MFGGDEKWKCDITGGHKWETWLCWDELRQGRGVCVSSGKIASFCQRCHKTNPKWGGGFSTFLTHTHKERVEK